MQEMFNRPSHEGLFLICPILGYTELLPSRIVSLHVPKSKGACPLMFPTRGADERGTVTVICGENGTGKSYILRALKDLVDAKQASNNFPGWKIETVGDNPIKIVHPHHHKERMNNIGVLSKAQAGKTIRKGDEAILLKTRLFGILLPIALKAFDAAESFDPVRWLDDPSYRTEVFLRLPESEESVGVSDVTGVDFLSLFSLITGGTLGFRRVSTYLELVLIWRNGVVAAYPDWSHGQKSLLAILAEVKIEQPDVCVYDEIENFFHPKFISQTLEFLKANVGQTILASHHPHLIFGRAIDEVYFVELNNPGPNALVPFQIKRRREQVIPSRHFTRLKDDFNKLAFAYKLFELDDAKLLVLAGAVSDSVDTTIRCALANAFECCAVGKRASPYPDTQSKAIGDQLEKHFQGKTSIRVLDWGAGVGRSPDELAKIPAGKGIHWSLFEPLEPAKSLLTTKFQVYENISILTSLEDVYRVQADVALLTNVLHALEPREFAEAIHSSWRAIVRDRGVLVISEIFPLLQPEKSAVPLPEFLLTKYLRALGFKVESIVVHIYGCAVYCLTARSSVTTCADIDVVFQHTIDLWSELRDEFQLRYRDFSVVRTIEDQKHLLNWVFGLARTHSCLTGY